MFVSCTRALSLLLLIVGCLCLNSTYSSSVAALEHLTFDDHELWRESSHVKIQMEFKCDRMNATFKSETDTRKRHIRSVLVNGMSIPEKLLQEMKQRLDEFGPYDYVSFICTSKAYSFSFSRWEPNQPDPTMILISGQLKELRK